MEGPRADSEEKQEPASDFDTALEDRLKALDPERPIREADIVDAFWHFRFVPMNEPARAGARCARRPERVTRRME